MLKIGEKAPEFELLNQDGISVALRDFLGKKVILYFYPKDNTPGCTTQACDFTQNYEAFENKNAVIIGVSPDSVKSHQNFIAKFNLKHILLSDSQKEVCKFYGAWGLKKNYGKEYEGLIRSTFVIDEEGKIAQIYSPVSVKEHALKVLESL
ncbi:thioredoxin-dependent thiol peroxidase [Campylobacter helveticus]|uniref:thioredoxin-dependent peroxiredoxin n=1 Tax=Campylobacter helveticus TaxID=28898 RepID=A0ABY3L0Y3_9BACT|nr:thioredoxin-dependent thiol peroxidase [Campylobacter helveticus]ARE81193.1 thiol peroxidase [Campylobacter helveticus]MCR2039869.1 thioredoxin-dependent thiol peroxidase [Campylobacter helveticus]MCR2054773.1 thioredoxin-dependent thiol peroxidase [Campylobacter helveticus]MCR2056862.1 thioredoxin-dependent thiol peroxidase [Campylobacter helveticus]MCR2060264.1 thioredoxin-dependent thiol peroxidase [Campylobacter helveticus]